MAKMNLTPLSELVDEVFGKEGTPKRDAMEERLKEETHAYYVGEAIRKARCGPKPNTRRTRQNVIGVQRSQICKLESGKSVITLPTMSRVFQAFGHIYRHSRLRCSG